MGNTTNRALLTDYLQGIGNPFGRNYVKNPSAFKNTTNTTANGTATVARNTTTPLTSIADFDITLPNNATDYISWTLNTLDNSLKGQNCELRLNYTASSVGSAVRAEVYQGSSLISYSSNLIVSTTSQQISVNAPCGDLSSATTVRISNATGNSGTSAIKAAELYYSKATNLGFIYTGEAQFVGSAYIAATTNCAPTVTNSGWSDFGTDTDCPGPTIDLNPGTPGGGGVIQTTDADLPQFTVNNLPAGNYRIRMQVVTASSATILFGYRISDGTTNSPGVAERRDDAANTHLSPLVLEGWFSYTSSGNRTFKIQCDGDGSNSCTLQIGTTSPASTNMTFSITRYPTASESAAFLNNSPSYWSGYHSNDCDWQRTNTAYGDFTDDASCTGPTTRQTSNFGTVSASGSVSPAITFTPVRTGAYWVCANPTGVESANTSRLRLTDGTTIIAEIDHDSGADRIGMSLCGIYNATSLSPVTLKLQGSAASGAIGINVNPTNGPASSIEWSVIQISPNIPTPNIVNTVVTPKNEGVRIASAYITYSGGTPSVSRQDGSWISSVSDTGTGDAGLNIVAGTFSSAPNCTCSAQSSGGTKQCTMKADATTSFIGVQQTTDGTTFQDNNFYIICVGPK